jgi:hypothetical protein
MVARIAPVESISETLSYNEEKVTQHRAECIHSKNFLQDTGKLSYADKLDRFQRLNDLNSRSRVKMLHATLNFEPAEKLSNAQLADIADPTATWKGSKWRINLISSTVTRMPITPTCISFLR